MVEPLSEKIYLYELQDLKDVLKLVTFKVHSKLRLILKHPFAIWFDIIKMNEELELQ